MLRVPNMRDAIAFYEGLGFAVESTDVELQGGGEIGWCALCKDGASLFLRPGPSAGREGHGDVTLCFDVADVHAYFQRIEARVEVVYAPKDQGYGRIDFEIRDLNGYRLLFGQDVA